MYSFLHSHQVSINARDFIPAGKTIGIQCSISLVQWDQTDILIVSWQRAMFTSELRLIERPQQYAKSCAATLSARPRPSTFERLHHRAAGTWTCMALRMCQARVCAISSSCSLFAVRSWECCLRVTPGRLKRRLTLEHRRARGTLHPAVQNRRPLVKCCPWHPVSESECSRGAHIGVAIVARSYLLRRPDSRLPLRVSQEIRHLPAIAKHLVAMAQFGLQIISDSKRNRKLPSWAAAAERHAGDQQLGNNLCHVPARRVYRTPKEGGRLRLPTYRMPPNFDLVCPLRIEI